MSGKTNSRKLVKYKRIDDIIIITYRIINWIKKKLLSWQNCKNTAKTLFGTIYKNTYYIKSL